MFILFFLYTFILGLYLLSFFPKDLPFLVKISLVYLLGTVFLTVLFFVCYPLLAVSEWFLYLPFIIITALLVVKTKSLFGGWRVAPTKNASDLLILLFSLSFSSFLFFKTIWFDLKTGQTLIAGKLWSDFGAHIPLIKSFSVGFNFPPQYPLFPGEPIRYHFLFDFLVGILERLGMPLSFAINIPSILSFTTLLLLIYSLGTLIFSRKIVGLLAILLTLFNSSWAFLSLFKKIPYVGNFLSWLSQIIHHKEFLAFGPYDQGIVTGFWNLNVYTNQRHFAFALAIMFLLIYLFFAKAVKDKKSLILIGIVIGFLPVLHSGVFLIAIMCLPLFFILFYSSNSQKNFFGDLKNFSYLLLPILIFSLPQLLYMQGTPSVLPEAGIKFRPGYLMFVNFQWLGFLKFWVFNLGLTLFLTPLGFLLAPKKYRLLFLLSVLPFVVGNLFSFSPDMATNHKFFNFTVIILNFYVAYLISRIASWKNSNLEARNTKQILNYNSQNSKRFENLNLGHLILFRVSIFGFRILRVFLVVVLFFSVTLSGLLDFFPILNDNFFGVPDPNHKADINWIEQNTNPKAIFANSYWLYHPASLAGRPIVLGWPYFSWSAGYDTNLRDKMQRELYRANNITRTCQLIQNLHVDYVTINTQIKDEATSFDLSFWQKNFPLVYQNPQSGFFIFKSDCSK